MLLLECANTKKINIKLNTLNIIIMNQIEKLKAVLEQEEKQNEEVFTKSAWCREHKFDIQADVLYKEYEAKRKLMQTIKMKVIDELLEV